MSEHIVTNKAKLWQVALFPLNNAATNIYLFSVSFLSYYATGIVGLGVVLVSTLMTSMRIWDAITDPIIGFLLDKTNGKFGKNRPFMVIGNLILMISTLAMYSITHRVPQNMRLLVFILIYLIYIIGYTFQCVVTKSGQTVLTNDPKQRPYFTIFDGIYNVFTFSGIQILVSNIWVKQAGGFNMEFFHKIIPFTIVASAICTVLAILAIWEKDRIEYFGLGKAVKIKFADYLDVLKNNRAIQMLIFAAATDKLCGTIASNSVVLVMLFGIIFGDYSTAGTLSMMLILPSIIIVFLGIKGIASRLGLKKALVQGSYLSLLLYTLLILLLVFGNPRSFSLSNPNFFTVAFIALYILLKGVMQITNGVVIPMTADCADYETYRSGRYVPGLIGTLFSSVDKIISSLATTIIGFAIALIGFKDVQPQPDTPYSTSIFIVTLILFFILPMSGFICNLIAMKFYPLSREKMLEIQDKIAEIKSKS